MFVLHASKLSMFMQKLPFAKLTPTQLRDGPKSRDGLPVDDDKTALVDRDATALISDAGRTASSNFAALEPIRHKVSDLSMTLEYQSHIPSCRALTA